ncbi:MAG: nucleotidyltransferase family protein [Caulobacteraceae bacterium]
MSDEARLEAILRASPILMDVFTRVRDLGLPDWLIFSGAIYQSAWNHLTRRPPDFGIKDYDLAYFDASDLSYEAEDAVIRRVAAAFEPPLRERVEARNQARVHLWFEDRYGEPYAPLSSSARALGRFVSPAFAVGARLEAGGRIAITAPFGLTDLFAMRLRPNPSHPSPNFTRVARNLSERWPELEIL